MMTLQTEQPGAHIGEHFWIKWVLANAVGFAVGAAVSLSLGLYGASLLPLASAASESVAGVVSRIIAWGSAIFGAVAIGAAQWFFLRGRVRWAGSWFLATSLAGGPGPGLLSPIFGAAPCATSHNHPLNNIAWQRRASCGREPDYGIVLIRVVPLLVPSLRHSSSVKSFLFTAKKSVPLMLTNSLGQSCATSVMPT